MAEITSCHLKTCVQKIWNLKQPCYIDLFKLKVPIVHKNTFDTANCTNNLIHSLFRSTMFFPEKLMLSLVYRKYSKLPETFEVGTRYLAWTVVDKEEKQVVLQWEMFKTKGLTILAYEIENEQVVYGNAVCTLSPTPKNFSEKLIIKFHTIYTNVLLNSMVVRLSK